MNNELKTLKCEICGKEIVKNPKLSNKQFENKRYCCVRCRQEGRSRNMKGKQLEQNNPNWKGDNATNITTFHKRVEEKFGKPNKCECCGDTKAKQYDWANMTGKYKDMTDYKRLCKSCHIRYDRTRLNTLKELPLSKIDKKILSLIAVKWVNNWKSYPNPPNNSCAIVFMDFFNLIEGDLE